jgi:hypothetical protein
MCRFTVTGAAHTSATAVWAASSECMHTHKHTHTSATAVWAASSECMHTHTHTHTHICDCRFGGFESVYAHTHKHTHTHTRTHTHTHTHTHTPKKKIQTNLFSLVERWSRGLGLTFKRLRSRHRSMLVPPPGHNCHSPHQTSVICL